MLEKEFKRAGVGLKLVNSPFISGRNMDSVVQIDIQRGRSGDRRDEWFRIYRPEGTMVEVRDVDTRLHQLVLMVQETAREFEEQVDHPRWAHDGNQDFNTWVKNFRRMNPKVQIARKVSPKGRSSGYIMVRRQTSARMRYFLAGLDERQLFIAQTTEAVTTVDQARRSLGRSVQFAEGKRRGSSMDRQGEWFFLETNAQTREEIEKAIKSTKASVRRNIDIGSPDSRRGAGNPHVADEYIRLPNVSTDGKAPIRPFRVFVRGKIRHSDHKTVRFSQWREVIRNNESQDSRGSNVFWVD